MINESEFIIDQVSWHTKVKDNPESPQQVYDRFRVIMLYLQHKNLLSKQFMNHEAEISDDFAIKSSDLTPLGLMLMKKCYDKWLKKIVNKSKDINDLRIFDCELSKLI